MLLIESGFNGCICPSVRHTAADGPSCAGNILLPASDYNVDTRAVGIDSRDIYASSQSQASSHSMEFCAANIIMPTKCTSALHHHHAKKPWPVDKPKSVGTSDWSVSGAHGQVSAGPPTSQRPNGLRRPAQPPIVPPVRRPSR